MQKLALGQRADLFRPRCQTWFRFQFYTSSDVCHEHATERDPVAWLVRSVYASCAVWGFGWCICDWHFKEICWEAEVEQIKIGQVSNWQHQTCKNAYLLATAWLWCSRMSSRVAMAVGVRAGNYDLFELSKNAVSLSILDEESKFFIPAYWHALCILYTHRELSIYRPKGLNIIVGRRKYTGQNWVFTKVCLCRHSLISQHSHRKLRSVRTLLLILNLTK